MTASPRILALETSGELCTVALVANDKIESAVEAGPRKHTQHILGLADNLLSQARMRACDLDAVAFGRGPGSFTGVRVATAVAQGLAVAHSLPLLPVSSLAAIAQSLCRAGCDFLSPVLVTRDARLGQIYWGLYEVQPDALSELHPETLSTPQELQALLPTLPYFETALGPGVMLPELRKYKDGGLDCFDEPHAWNVLELALQDFRAGRFADFAQAQPTYLRHPVRS